MTYMRPKRRSKQCDSKQTKQALLRLEDRYRRLLAHVGDVIYETEHATRTYCYLSPGIQALTGIPDNEFTMFHWHTMMEASRMLGENEQISETEAAILTEQGELERWHAEFLIRAYDGQRRWLLDRSVQIYDENGKATGSLGILNNITARKQEEEALLQSKERLQAALDAARMICWERNFLTGQTLCSTDLAAFLGLPPSVGDAADADIYRFIHPGDHEKLRTAVERCLAERTPLDIELRAALDHDERWFAVRGLALRDGAGVPIRLVGLCWEVTDQKRLQEQLFQSQRMESLGSLVGVIAHDFNNLLQIIIGFVELAEEEVADDENRMTSRYLAKVTAAAEHARQITRRLLEFARKRPIHPQVFDLNRLLQGLEPILHGLYGNQIALSLCLTPGACPILADPTQIEQVVLNLCTNARDAILESGGVTLTTELVTRASQEDAPAPHRLPPGRYVRLTIQDTGVGMKEETQKRIFEPFFTTKEAGKGTGLGLATCHGIIRNLRGEIKVSSKYGEGSTFEIELPCSMELLSEDLQPESVVHPGGGETILLAEDNALVLEYAATVLKGQGYNVLTASHGLEALQLASAHTNPIHLLLTDILMPQMSGTLLAERLKSLRPNLKILFMSAYAEPSSLYQYSVVAQGFSSLEKPFSSFALLSKVREILQRSD